MPVENEDTAGCKRHEKPDGVLGPLAPCLVQSPRRLVELHAGIAIAFEKALNHEKKVGPYRLRTKISAPDAAEERRHEEEADRGEDQQAGDIVDFLRPYLEAEDVEPSSREIGQHGLIGRAGSAIPPQPGQQIVDA
jgi:hypothetical protein